MSIFKESSINKRVKLLAPGTPSCIISLIILVFKKNSLPPTFTTCPQQLSNLLCIKISLNLL